MSILPRSVSDKAVLKYKEYDQMWSSCIAVKVFGGLWCHWLYFLSTPALPAKTVPIKKTVGAPENKNSLEKHNGNAWIHFWDF